MSTTRRFNRAVLLTMTPQQHSAWKAEAKRRRLPLARWVRFCCGREVRRMKRRREQEELATVAPQQASR